MQKSVRRTKRRLTAERNKDKLGNLGINRLRRSAGLLPQLIGLKTKSLADRRSRFIQRFPRFGTNTFCFLSHLVFAYFVPGSHPFDFKIATSGARALLAMTESVGFAGKRDGFRNETFEKRRRAAPRKNARIKR